MILDKFAEEKVSHVGQRIVRSWRSVVYRARRSSSTERLEADNTKSFWETNRDTYKTVVKGPVTDLCDSFDGFGSFHLFRPHNDLRFSKNKPPYKTHQGAFCESVGGSGWYFHLSRTGIYVGSGFHTMASDQLQRYREAVADSKQGPKLAKVVDTLRAAKVDVSSFEQLKTAPRGWPKDHPRIDLLQRKGIHAGRDFKVAKWMHTSECRDRLAAVWVETQPLCDWFDKHVGPSELPPEERGFFG